MNRFVKLFKKSKIGALGVLVYLWILISIGIYDALIFESYPPFSQVVPKDETMADMFWAYGSIHFGLLFFIGPLAMFYHPIVSISKTSFKLVENYKKGFVVWLVWLTKMLLIGTFVEQGTVWFCRTLFFSFNLTPTILSKDVFYLWISGPIKIYYPSLQGVILYNVAVLVGLIVLWKTEKFLRKKWGFYR